MPFVFVVDVAPASRATARRHDVNRARDLPAAGRRDAFGRGRAAAAPIMCQAGRTSFTARRVAATTVSTSARVMQSGGAKPRISP